METPLTPEEVLHLSVFAQERPDWQLFVLAKRWSDESAGEVEHEYPRANPYLLGMKYVMDYVLPLGRQRVLDIGSPLAQNLALSCAGYPVTVVDVRAHPDAGRLGLEWVRANGTSLPYADKSWPLVTSCWVVGHVGDGRYGDGFDVDGDRKILREIARVCSGSCVIGVGLVGEHSANIYNLHRIYSWDWLDKAFLEAGLEVTHRENLPVRDDVYFGASFDDHRELVRRDGYYGIVTARPVNGS